MKKAIFCSSIFMLVTFSIPANAGHGRHGDIHHCLKSASRIKEGYFVKVEYLTLTNRGSDSYEIEIKDKNGVEWEMMCDSSTGDIYELEREVDSASDPLFQKNMKVKVDTAMKTALELYPGRIVNTEYEIKANGNASYEFDIVDALDVTYKIEINAETGNIIDVSIEKWDIGREYHE